MLDVQLHLSDNATLRAEVLRPIENTDLIVWRNKPAGGFWTSTFDEKSDSSEWQEYCRGKNLAIHHRFLLVPHPDARIATISSYKTYADLLKRYPRTCEHRLFEDEVYLDYEAMTQDFDGVHLTDRGELETRLTWPNNLYGWDVESTIWFRWSFIKVEPARSLSNVNIF